MGYTRGIIYALSRQLRADYAFFGRWRKVADKYGITTGLAYRIVHERYEPKSPILRCKLGLPALIPTAACPIHGVVHVGPCPKPPRPHRYASLFDWPVAELKRALEKREEWK